MTTVTLRPPDAIGADLAICTDEDVLMRTADAATRAGMSTGSSLGVVLNAPGNYVRGTVGNVDKAKTAARLANRTIDARMNIDPANPAGN